MLKGKTWSILFHHVAVAVLYGSGYALLREITFSHWATIHGLRLTVLLLVSYRFWPALIAGELVPLSYNSYMCATDYGETWAIVNAIPPIGLIMPLVYVFRERFRLVPRHRPVNIAMFLLSTLIAIFILAGTAVISTYSMHLSPGTPPNDYPAFFARYLIGDYLGILAIAPLALSVREVLVSQTSSSVVTRLIESRVLLEGASLLLPISALVWFGLNATPGTGYRSLIQLAMFLPVVSLAMRHGWQGAAIAGTQAAFAIMMLMPARRDLGTLQAEVLLAFAMTTMLLMGARISALNRKEQLERDDVRRALSLAQRNVFASEGQLRRTAQLLEQTRLLTQTTFFYLIDHLRRLMPEVNEHEQFRRAKQIQDQLQALSYNLNPVDRFQCSFPSAMRCGSVARALEESCVRYDLSLRGPVSRIPTVVHRVIYKIFCISTTLLCASKRASDIRVRLRCGRRKGRRCVMICVEAYFYTDELPYISWNTLLPQLRNASGDGGIESIHDLAQTFDGKAHYRMSGNVAKVTALMFEPEILPSQLHGISNVSNAGTWP
ncbi:MASE1 domain-containing protein [Burkholderia pseudomallei]|uniref:MASE1 domain-containing protein n=1 Tax=Burkholderia pseudomallei TaxID=28450 RepID=UPI00294669DB|nr:MASE1 family protein [Burkholderia pseudomallei]